MLKNTKTIAIVGLSDKVDRDSYQVALYLQNAGYTIIPINPNITSWNGIKAYPRLLDIPNEIHIDIVDIFRKSEFIEQIVDEVLAMKNKPKAIWMQLGIENEEAKKKAEHASILVIENKCIKIEHQKFF